ncbi:hypothetical protein EYF80_035345 [Liparis tanakae]|uniref:Uncharacterized protein n=1 Tax=Liparis tanakae TaxID=230148 RepID=A0A4Z2GLR1_9TELE|nr:hypothetical protein EYF80_035345 [Liparis tanakae]
MMLMRPTGKTSLTPVFQTDQEMHVRNDPLQPQKLQNNFFVLTTVVAGPWKATSTNPNATGSPEVVETSMEGNGSAQLDLKV